MKYPSSIAIFISISIHQSIGRLSIYVTESFPLDGVDFIDYGKRIINDKKSRGREQKKK
jgi:hypothetical protein